MATAGTTLLLSLFFGSLKNERIKKRIYKTRQLATEDISDYIESFYNQTRRHQHVGGVSPNDFEALAKQQNSCVH